MKHKSFWVWLLTIIIIGLVKAHLHMIRLIILAAIGLAGLYMIHKLAQDFQSIRKQLRPRGLGIFKRSTNEWLEQRLANETKEMKQIIPNDPIGCARKFVCHISQKNKSKLTRAQDNVLNLLRAFRWLDLGGDWKKAEEIGTKNGKDGGCEHFYKKCLYSGEQLAHFMSILD